MTTATTATTAPAAPAQATTLHTVLWGFGSASNPYEINDYPYGATQRCKKQYWVETATKGAKNGQMRVVTRTQNPTTKTWNAPKAGTFSDLAFLYIDAETGYVEGTGISVGSTSAIQAFKALWYDVLPTELQIKLEEIEKRDAKLNENVWNIAPSTPINLTPIAVEPEVEPEPVPVAAEPEQEVIEPAEEAPAEVPEAESFDPFPAPSDDVFAKVLSEVNLQAQGLDASLIKVPGKGYVLRYDNVDLCQPVNLKFVQSLLNKQERALENGKDYFESLVKKLTAPKPAKAPKSSVVNPTAAGKSDNYYRPQRAKGDTYEIQPQAVALGVRPGSKIAAIVDALKAGLPVSDISAVLGDDTDENKIQSRVTKRGYGIRKANGVLTLIEPAPAQATA